jgi:hypothetical protein
VVFSAVCAEIYISLVAGNLQFCTKAIDCRQVDKYMRIYIRMFVHE